MYSDSQQRDIVDRSIQFLNKDITIEEIDDLRAVLRFHEYKYYVESQPLISDYEYDLLYKSLEKLESEYPESITPDSPTQRVASDLNGDFPPAEHIVPMLSLGNSYNADDLRDFDRQIKKLCKLEPDTKVEYSVEPKFDGGSIAIIYEDDILKRAATRGNGFTGEEMTPNAKAMPSMPLKANFSSKGIKKVELRGESLIKKSLFLKINDQRAHKGLPVFANPRNAATGGLRMKDPNETRARGIETFVFQLGYAIDRDGNDVLPTLEKHTNGIALLGELGFKIPRKGENIANDIEEAISLCKKWEEGREEYPYEIDGMVIKVNQYHLQEICGSTQHHPRWAIAYKFKAKQATSKLINVDYQIGKIGSITPVAKIEPVQLAGVTVSSVSLHNEDFITSRDLRIGDTVVVERAGDVIPYIVKSLDELRDGSEEKIIFPHQCPSCDTQLIREEDEAAWRCPNTLCPAQQLQKMIFHVSKDAMNIDGFGKSYIEKFYELGWIKDISDIYHLDYDKIAGLEGFGVKSAENLRNAIESAKKNSISRVLHSLSIHHLGKKASKIIAQHIPHIMDLKDWEIEQYTEIKDIGPVVAKNTHHFFHDEDNLTILNRMEEYGVNFYQMADDQPIIIEEGAVLSGKTILFTGTLMKMKRNEAKKLAEENGAKNISAVSGNLDILVVGEKAGSKLKKAQEIGTVNILSEDEFLALIGK